jgi:hypothetical protein
MQSFEKEVFTYLTTNKLYLSQQFTESIDDTLESFIQIYRNGLLEKGIDIYKKQDMLYFEGIYSYNEDHFNAYDDHFSLELKIWNDSTGENLLIGENISEEIGLFYIRLNENLTENFYIPGWDADKVGKNHQIISEFDLNPNQQAFGIDIKVNSLEVFEKFDSDTETTLQNLVDNYKERFNKIALDITNSGNTLIVNGLLPDVWIWKFEPTVNFFSNFEIIENSPNRGTIIESSQLINQYGDFPPDTYTGIDLINETELSTGMIISIEGTATPPSGLTFLNSKEFNIINLLRHNIQLSYQGYIPEFSGLTFGNILNEQKRMGSLTINSQQYVRRPRAGVIDQFINPGSFSRAFSRAFNTRYFEEGQGKDYYFRFRWEEDEGEEPEIFFYDFTGEQPDLAKGPLDPSGFRIDSLKYTGPVPLIKDDAKVPLNNQINLNTDLVNDPTAQKTVFEELEYLLDKRNTRNAELLPEPLQVFVGFNSKKEGVSEKTLIMEIVEYVKYEGETNSELNQNNIEFKIEKDERNENIAHITRIDNRFTGNTENDTFSYLDLGFEAGQDIKLYFYDKCQIEQRIFENYEKYKILRIEKNNIEISIEDKHFVPFWTSGKTDGFDFKIEVQPIEVFNCRIFGETEIEDKRFDLNLKMLGARVDSEMEKLFEKSDINDEGIDYILLNKKRKEMLLNYPEIYNYIGSYKALINAIKFFGYDTLKLKEYYRNIDTNSPMYEKLFKVEVEDLFSNLEEGYSKSDWIEKQFNTKKFKKTNLFNLTYDITDDVGNNILHFSLEEVQIKLEGIKKWLRRYMLPISTNIMDITGVANVIGDYKLRSDVSNQVTKFTNIRETTAIDFFVEQTLNFDKNYLATINFYNIGENFDPTKGWSFKLKTFSKDETGKLIVQQSFNVDKYNLEPFTFNYNKDIDPYLFIETIHYDEQGLGFTKTILRNMQIARNYQLINKKLIPYKQGLRYLNLYNPEDKSNEGKPMNFYYFFDDEGYMIISEKQLNQNYPEI